jgi:hypothetical protein
LRTIWIIITTVVGSLLLIWLVQGDDFILYRYFSLKYEQTRRGVFEQSKAYRQGMVQELENMRFSYETADSTHRQALASLILHRASDFDESALNPDLRDFIHKLRNQKSY